ncbi:MAG: hypothetical protein ACW992_11790, partial [Candidatus Thorarchaeota archaeon]
GEKLKFRFESYRPKLQDCSRPNSRPVPYSARQWKRVLERFWHNFGTDASLEDLRASDSIVDTSDLPIASFRQKSFISSRRSWKTGRGAVQESDGTRGRILFDERGNETLRERKKRERLIVRAVSILSSVAFLIFVLNILGLIPFKDVPLEMTIVFFLAATIFLGLGIFFFAQTLLEDYIIVYQNGIEIRRGLLSKEEYFPFEAISRIWTDLRDNKGVQTEDMAFEHTITGKRRRRLLSKDLFVDVDGFLKSIEEAVFVESQPITLSELWKEV